MRDIRPHLVLFAIVILLTALLGVLFASKSLADDSKTHFLIGSHGPRDDIDLVHFLERLTTEARITKPADLIQIPRTAFEPVLNTRGPGYTKNTVWYRAPFVVDDRLATDQNAAFIRVGAAYLNDIALSIISGETGQTVWWDHVGDRVPPRADQLTSPYPTLQWPELSSGHYWLTIGVKTNSAHVFEAKLLPESTMIASTGQDSYLKGVYLGVLIVAFGIYLAFGMLSRDKAVCWYSVYILAMFFINLGVSGYAHLMFTSFWPLASDAITGSGTALSIGSSLIMWCYIIRVNEYFPKTFRAIASFAALAMLGFVTSTSDWYIIYAKLFFISDICLLVVLLILLVYISFREKNLMRYSFLMVALGIPTIAVIVHLMMLTGLTPINAFTQNIYPMSSTVHIVMIGIAMGFRTFKLAHGRAEAFSTSQHADQLAGEQRTFITMLSHEFRTPLAIIQRSAEILGLHLQNEQQAIISRLATIRSNAGQLSSLVDAFLTKDTLDNAAFTTSREAVAIDTFLSELIARRHREVPGQNISLLHLEMAVVEIDRVLMERAILNLIENARKYAPGAAVWVSSERAANGYLYIRVVDEGPGIPVEELGNVLDAFYRGRDAAKTQGVGLGLHLTNRIIKAHDGTLSLSVGEKGGTTVLIKLPFDRDKTVLHGTRNRVAFHEQRSETPDNGGPWS